VNAAVPWLSNDCGRDIFEKKLETEESIDEAQDEIFLAIAFGYLKSVCCCNKTSE
jgi:hypothetical protein